MREQPELILKKAIFEAQTWSPGRSRFALENDFYQLMLAGPSLNSFPELWRKYRRALAENEHLADPDLRLFLKRKQYAKEGYWWFDPGEWITIRSFE